MVDLTNKNEIAKLDPQSTIESTEILAKQCKDAWEKSLTINVPSDYKNITNIICCGMGASIYGALVLKALEGEELTHPIECISDYNLPKYANEKTLIILTSYSGSTEEVLSCAEQAIKKGAKILALTQGGKLAEFAKKNNIPSFLFDGKLNVSGVPRLGAGYTVLGLIGLLYKSGIININKDKLTDALEKIQEYVGQIKKECVKEASVFINKIPIVIAAEHLSGNAQILRNQFNETSKTFSANYLVPDLNHHLMEGLKFPSPNKLFFVIINSNNYSSKIKKRMQLTKDVIEQNKHATFEYNPNGKNIYEDFLITLIHGGYLTLYLGLLYNQNPAVNPWVDYFKEQLAK